MMSVPGLLVLVASVVASLFYVRWIQQEQAELQLLLNQLQEAQPEPSSSWMHLYLLTAVVWSAD